MDIDPTDGLLRSEARIGSRSAVQVGGVDVESSIHARGGAQVGVRTGLVFSGLGVLCGGGVSLVVWCPVSVIGRQGSSYKAANRFWHGTEGVVWVAVVSLGVLGGNDHDAAANMRGCGAEHLLVHAAGHVEGPGRHEG